MRQQLGFNLLELITAVLITCILALIATPFFISFIQNYRLSATADDLQYYLQLARTEAVKRNANVYVSFATGDTWCYGINPGSACDCTSPSGCALGTVSYASAQQISLAVSGMTGNNFYYEGTHGASSAPASATFSLYSNTSTLITLTINQLGNTSICSTGISGYTAC